ncbi:hypothetical protein QF030_007257 [Streptomyces rishiriensis]|uniref:Uncharacterized protein n=1 Tax=Streptomyces rishiriensis TaxID=68264 RepID=A0ABU0P162_STRRH|nr:hypothetical protein [Streptomyces rishiriensis]
MEPEVLPDRQVVAPPAGEREQHGVRGGPAHLAVLAVQGLVENVGGDDAVEGAARIPEGSNDIMRVIVTRGPTEASV